MSDGSPSGSATMCCSQTFSKRVLGPNIKSISVVSLYCRAVLSERTSFIFSGDDPTHLRGGHGLLQSPGLEAEAAEIETSTMAPPSVAVPAAAHLRRPKAQSVERASLARPW